MHTDLTFNASTHNGFVTVNNPKTGQHRTFRIWTATRGGLKGKRIVSLLTGPDRSTDWMGFGFATPNGIQVWKRLEGMTYEQYASILTRTEDGIKYGLEYLFEGRCRKCNKTLTNPVAIQTGIGPVCGGHGNAKSALETLR